MIEKDFRRIVVRVIEEAGGHVSRVESPETSPGIPDLNWCVRGAEGWTELKVQQKDGSAPEIRPTQRAWARRRIKAGGFVSFLCAMNNGTVVIVDGEDIQGVVGIDDWYEMGNCVSMQELINIFNGNPTLEN